MAKHSSKQAPALAKSSQLRAAPMALVAMTALLGVLGTGVILGRLSVQEPRSTKAACEQTEAAEAPTPTPPAQKRRTSRSRPAPDYLTRPAELYVATDPLAEQKYQDRQADELLALFDNELRKAALIEQTPDPEATANRIDEYLRGLSDALLRTAPDLADSLSTKVEARICTAETSATKLMVLSRFMHSMPEVASEKAFDCAVSRNPEENVVLWAMLDAWRDSGLPKSDALARMQSAARDPRTQRRFLSREEEMRIRLAPPSPESDEATGTLEGVSTKQ
jgi:hypothetical protein